MTLEDVMNGTVKVAAEGDMGKKEKEIPDLKHASEEKRGDSEYVFWAVHENGLQLQYASEALKNDREIVMEAVGENGMALQYASRELRGDKNVVYNAVFGNNGLALQFAADELKSHRRIVEEAVRSYGRALEFADDELKNDRDIVYEAVCNDGNAMEFASVELKKDRDFVLGAVTARGVALIYAADEFRHDKEIANAAVFSNGLVFQYIADSLKYDRGIALTAIFSNGKALQYVPDDLRYDKDFLVAAVRQSCEALAYVPDEFRSDNDVVMTAKKRREEFEQEEAERERFEREAAEREAMDKAASEKTEAGKNAAGSFESETPVVAGATEKSSESKPESKSALGDNAQKMEAKVKELTTKRNSLLVNKVIAGLKSRNMSGYYAADRAEALKIALELIDEGSSVTMGGCMSAHQIGLVDALTKGNYNFIDRDAYEDKRAAMLMAYDADVFLSSANAMTEDGVIINIDGNSNRVSAIAQGPKKVVFIVGMNKICSDADAALKRARNVAAPINAQRFGLSTPCTKTGACMDCKSPDTICCQFLITRYSRHSGRIHVILVDDVLGF